MKAKMAAFALGYLASQGWEGHGHSAAQKKLVETPIYVAKTVALLAEVHVILSEVRADRKKPTY